MRTVHLRTRALKWAKPVPHLNGGDLVVCLVDSKMQLAKLRKVADELWLEGKKFKVKYRETKYVYKVISLHIVKHLENMTLAVVAGLVGLSGLIAGVVQLMIQVSPNNLV